jgi:hypothetical protein
MMFSQTDQIKRKARGNNLPFPFLMEWVVNGRKYAWAITMAGAINKSVVTTVLLVVLVLVLVQ